MVSATRRHLTWLDIDVRTIQLQLKLRIRLGLYNLSGYRIVGVSRGGLIPSVMLSHGLDIPIVDVVVNVNASDDLDAFIDTSSKVVVVDDVCDSGNSFTCIKQAYPNACYAALFAKPKGLACHPELVYVEEVPQDVWLVYPWEQHDSPSTRDQDLIKL